MNNPTYLGLDFETTGVSPTLDRPVQIGLIMRDAGQDYPLINMLCNPGLPIQPGAAAVHGITEKMVAGQPSAYDSVKYLSELVEYYAQGRESYLITYNGFSYDVPMANNTLGRAAFSIPHIDVLRLIRHHFPEIRGGLGGKKLTELYEVFLGKPLEHAHDAVADISASMDLLDVLLARLGKTAKEMADEQLTPRPYSVMPLGKYIGMPVAEVPRSWAAFMAPKQDLDPDLRATVDAILARP
jgi:DNA polymerase-3 subunit epsilon